MERHKQLYRVPSLLAAAKICVRPHTRKAPAPHLNCTKQGGLCVPARTPVPTSCSQHGLTPSLLSLHNAGHKGAGKNQNVFVIPPSLTGHHKGTTGSFHLYQATYRKTDQHSQEQKRKTKIKRNGMLFYRKRQKSERYLAHWKHKSWIPSQNNYPRLTLPLSRNRSLNTFPLLLPEQKNGRVPNKLLRKTPQNLLPSFSSRVPNKFSNPVPNTSAYK